MDRPPMGLRRAPLLVAALAALACGEAIGQRRPPVLGPATPTFVETRRVGPTSVARGRDPETRVAPAPGLFPRRNDYAWEGMVVGAIIGLGIGIGVNSVLGGFGDGRGVGAQVAVLAAPMVVTVPVGLLIGGAIPKSRREGNGQAAPS